MPVTYTAVYEPLPANEGGGYYAYVEELPGAVTQGETLDEARANLQDAIRSLLAANRQLATELRGSERDTPGTVRETIAA
jgi:predicted RNase H-like HicB family nuclease